MVLLHPITVAALVVLQATALVKHLLGIKPRWKGRGVAGEVADTAKSGDRRPLLPVEPMLFASSDVAERTQLGSSVSSAE